MMNDQMRIIGHAGLRQLCLYFFLIAYQNYIAFILTDSFYRTQHNLRRCVVAPHRINCNSHKKAS